MSSCKCRSSSVFRYHESSQMSSLVETFVSKASALQRQGRAGRVRNGFCFRLYPKFRYEAPPGTGGENHRKRSVVFGHKGRGKRSCCQCSRHAGLMPSWITPSQRYYGFLWKSSASILWYAHMHTHTHLSVVLMSVLMTV